MKISEQNIVFLLFHLMSANTYDRLKRGK